MQTNSLNGAFRHFLSVVTSLTIAAGTLGSVATSQAELPPPIAGILKLLHPRKDNAPFANSTYANQNWQENLDYQLSLNPTYQKNKKYYYPDNDEYLVFNGNKGKKLWGCWKTIPSLQLSSEDGGITFYGGKTIKGVSGTSEESNTVVPITPVGEVFKTTVDKVSRKKHGKIVKVEVIKFQGEAKEVQEILAKTTNVGKPIPLLVPKVQSGGYYTGGNKGRGKSGIHIKEKTSFLFFKHKQYTILTELSPI